jgi:hypothetical protein
LFEQRQIREGFSPLAKLWSKARRAFFLLGALNIKKYNYILQT